MVGVQKRKTGELEAVNECGKRTKSRELETRWEFLKQSLEGKIESGEPEAVNKCGKRA